MWATSRKPTPKHVQPAPCQPDPAAVLLGSATDLVWGGGGGGGGGRGWVEGEGGAEGVGWGGGG